MTLEKKFSESEEFETLLSVLKPEGFEPLIIGRTMLGQIDGSLYPKDGSRFELNLPPFFMPQAYWDEEAGCFTAETPDGWLNPFRIIR